MPARRARVLPILLAAVLTGCVDGGTDAGDRAPVDPASVPAHAAPVQGPAMQGTVRGADGSPVPGARVIVTLLRSKSERTSIGLGAAFSLGLSCFAEKRGCRAPTTTGVSAADGTYAVAVPENKGGKPVGVALSVVATAGNPADPVPETDLPRTGTTITFPAEAAAGSTFDVPVGTAPLKLSAQGNRLRANLPATHGAAPAGPLQVTLTQLPAEGDVSTPTTDFSETPAKLPFDLRVAEDSRLLVVARREARIGKLPVTLSGTSILIGSAAPASRDAPCRVTDSRGKALTQKPCGLTDGVLGTAWTPTDDPRCADGPCPGTAQKDHRDIYITLADPVRARLLVLRGCGFTCTVQVSADGTHFRDLPTPDSGRGSGAGTDGFYVQPLSGAPVRVVHVRTSTGGFFSKLREVSLFR